MPLDRKKIFDEFMNRPISRQRKCQLRWQRDGKCDLCGTPVNLFATKCDQHGFAQRKSTRRRHRCQAWRPGGPGRPPMEVQTNLTRMPLA